MRRSTLISEVVWMKRFLILLTALILLGAVIADVTSRRRRN